MVFAAPRDDEKDDREQEEEEQHSDYQHIGEQAKENDMQTRFERDMRSSRHSLHGGIMQGTKTTMPDRTIFRGMRDLASECFV